MQLNVTLILAAALALGGCAKSTTSTPTVPTPPQMQVATAVAAFSTANDAAVHSAIAARQAGTCSPADAASIETAAKANANLVLQMDAELKSTDAWAVQGPKLLAILQSAALGQLNAHLSPNAQILVAALLTAANALSTSLGGPTI